MTTRKADVSQSHTMTPPGSLQLDSDFDFSRLKRNSENWVEHTSAVAFRFESKTENLSLKL